MQFGWINGINTVTVIILVLINIIAGKKGLCSDLRSTHLLVNLFEQIGRYGCMLFMILPAFTRNWKFSFGSMDKMFIWLGLTVLLLTVYILLWMKKRNGSTSILYGLATVPVILFLVNGLLLCHPALIIVSLIFGGCHLMIVHENAHLSSR